MSKIVRTPTRAEGGITPEEKERLDKVAQEWISIALRTDPIEPGKIAPAIEGLYRAAGLKTPRVVVVPSPLVMAFAYGASAAIWHNRATFDATANATRSATDNATANATRIATRNATYSATANATDNATRRATYSATYSATNNATYSATARATDRETRSATRSATHIATRIATDRETARATYRATYDAPDGATYRATGGATVDATVDATVIATDDATYSATARATDRETYRATVIAESGAAMACFDLAGKLGLECAKRWWNAYQGGNMWAGSAAYIAGARDVLGLDLKEHKAYAAWEDAARHGGFRVMHPEFCIVSDFPEFIRTDDNNLPHCETGPSHRWRDGWSLYHWHGVSVPGHWIEDPDSVDPQEVLSCDNVEKRAAGLKIIGLPRMLSSLDVKVIDEHENPSVGSLIEIRLDGLPDPARALKAECPRNGTIIEYVARVSDIDGLPIETAIAAQAWRNSDPVSEYIHPSVRT